jgi:4-hydroxybenzoate polyprenyltransferase
LKRERLAKAVVKALSWMRPWRCVHYVGATIFGILLGYRIIGSDFEIARSTIAVVSVFLNFQGMIVLNNLIDRSIDRLSGKKTPVSEGAIDERGYAIWGFGLSSIGALAAFAISYPAFLIVIAAHITSFLYSSPPFRLKRFFPLNTIFISLSTYLAMMFGYSIYGLTKTFMSFPPKLTLLFMIVFTLSLSFKDRLDQKGDREGGIHTLYTLLGVRKGSIVNGILICASYCSVPLILRYHPLLFAAVPAGALSLFFLTRDPFREEPVFVIYFLFADVFIFTIWKNIGLILPEF